MNKELFLSILAMDSYNRGYGQAVLLNSADSTTNQNESGRPLGNAIIADVNLPNDSIAAGFYAIAYDVTMVKDADGIRLLSDSDQVISISGTDRHFALSY